MSSEYIPFEIQAEILKWLPVKPLFQFRSVSKSYKCLIDSPDFIVSYGVRHPQPDRFILRYEERYVCNRHISFVDKYISFVDKYISFVDNEDDGFVQQQFIPIIPTVPALIHRLDFSVVGSSHGLLCFHGYHEYQYSDGIKEMVVLWNPSIRKSVGIQVPFIYTMPDERFNNVGFHNAFSFGVCPATSEPIILIIRCVHYKRKMEYMPGISVPWTVWVFTLSTGTWSILSTNLPRESIGFYRGLYAGSQVVIDRFIYWIVYDYMLVDAEDGPSESPFLIMSFDLTAKEFKEINLTGNLTSRFCSIQTISKLRESLVLLEYHREFKEGVPICSLWMMKKKCDNISFTKLYNINVPHGTVNTLLGFRKTGELILETQQEDKDDAELEIYNPNSEAIDNLGIDGDDYSFFMCSYVETLLLHDQLDGFTYWISKQSQIEDVE